jgi:hypothetical protein
LRFALLALFASGCLLKPDRVTGDGGVGDSGHHDGGGLDANPDFVPRLIARAYWNNDGGMSSPNMTGTSYSLASSGVVEGDLLLIIGNIDNGPTVSPPDGFQPIMHHFFGEDGQTYFAFSKVATGNQPAAYSCTYTNYTSGGATFVLLAIHGANPDTSNFRIENDPCTSSCGSPQVPAPSSGVTTTAPGSLVVYAAGADWRGQSSTAGFMMPSGFTQLAAFGDKGNGDYWWSTEMVGWELAPTTGPTGTISGTLTDISGNNVFGSFWSFVIAIAPA